MAALAAHGNGHGHHSSRPRFTMKLGRVGTFVQPKSHVRAFTGELSRIMYPDTDGCCQLLPYKLICSNLEGVARVFACMQRTDERIQNSATALVKCAPTGGN
eukprot:5399060-Pleurochrysis_carterae.AAC.1